MEWIWKMIDEEIKKMTKEDYIKLKNYLELIDPKSKVFSETKDLLQKTEQYKDNNDIRIIESLYTKPDAPKKI